MCALAATWGWSGLLGFEPQLLDYLVVGTGVVAVYELNRLTDLLEDAVNCAREARLAQRQRRRILWTALSAGATAQLLALTRTPLRPSLMVTGVLGLGLLYSVPLPTGRAATRLKAIPLVKNLAAAAGWAVCVVLYPALTAGRSGPQLWSAFVLMLMGAFVVEVIWDLRDLEGDPAGGIITLPLLLGLAGSRVLLLAVCAGAATLVVTGWAAGWLDWTWSLLLANSAAFALGLVFLPDHAWSWRPLSTLVVLLQATLLFELGVLTRAL
jgi:4-hydroxybenzoate polyprenyltransferase